MNIELNEPGDLIRGSGLSRGTYQKVYTKTQLNNYYLTVGCI